MKNRKAKGSKGERELVKFFNENEFSCIRAAGSGSSQYPSPDILAGNAIRRLAIECKVTKDKKKYFSGSEIEQLRTFSNNFGAEAWAAIKFPDHDWYFLMLEDLENTGKCWLASLEKAKIRGLTKEELLQNSDENRKV
ncbi:Holliday junction resolvase [Candidatus Woesearchaeota archaeon]|jgi:Holliday junction resolvase|nr:Holliday junction resolvase [Candidatus Woesearchaeota archaeon]MBT4336024.1 Holliday junction resolvase [Candidatus Woesearchaeota archaeon]MBT4468997.1 Holliday junction resolvase [Candidatus Woesearchaeota archaeon]MBT6744684.1 Holliday junction resolvase [Candidatus Woesearchaeota archaeon]